MASKGKRSRGANVAANDVSGGGKDDDDGGSAATAAASAVGSTAQSIKRRPVMASSSTEPTAPARRTSARLSGGAAAKALKHVKEEEEEEEEEAATAKRVKAETEGTRIKVEPTEGLHENTRRRREDGTQADERAKRAKVEPTEGEPENGRRNEESVPAPWAGLIATAPAVDAVVNTGTTPSALSSTSRAVPEPDSSTAVLGAAPKHGTGAASASPATFAALSAPGVPPMTTTTATTPRRQLPPSLSASASTAVGAASATAKAFLEAAPMVFATPSKPKGRVTVTEAMRLYAMTRDEMEEIPYELEENPIFTRAADTMVFDHAVVRAASEAKWLARGTTLAAELAKREASRAKRQAAAAQKRAAIQQEKNGRAEQLLNALRARGVMAAESTWRLKATSVAFIEGTGDATLDDAVNAVLKARSYTSRRKKLAAALKAHGHDPSDYVPSHGWSRGPRLVSDACTEFLDLGTDDALKSVLAAVAVHLAEVEEAERKVVERRAALAALLTARGITPPETDLKYPYNVRCFITGHKEPGDVGETTLEKAADMYTAIVTAAAKIEAEQAPRRSKITAALAARGLDLRSDSKLCKEYIEGTATMPLSAIVDRMETMHVLHAHTNYGVRSSSSYSSYRSRYNERRYDDNDDDDDGRGYYAAYDRGDGGRSFTSTWRSYQKEIEEECLTAYALVLQAGGPRVEAAPLCKCGRKLLWTFATVGTRTGMDYRPILGLVPASNQSTLDAWVGKAVERPADTVPEPASETVDVSSESRAGATATGAASELATVDAA